MNVAISKPNAEGQIVRFAAPVACTFSNSSNFGLFSVWCFYTINPSCTFAGLTAAKRSKFWHGFRSFLTTRADYSSDVNCSYKAVQDNKSSGKLHFVQIARGHGRNLPCQALKYARSGRAADAVRVHSSFALFDRSPTRSTVSLASSFFLSLTPARCGAKELGRQISARYGFGVAVLAGTVSELWQNQQHIDFIAFSCAVLGFQPSRACYAHVRVCAMARAYMCEGNARTSELSINIYLIQYVIGSRAVPARFQPEPQLQNGGFARFSIKIMGRYGRKLPSKGLMWGGGRDFFGLFRPAGAWAARSGVDQGSCGELGAAMLGDLLLSRQSDGFLRVSACPGRAVGIAMLECIGQGTDLMCKFAHWPLPIGKAGAMPWARAAGSAGHPPLPPFASSPSSISIAPERDRILEGLRRRPARLNHIGSKHCGLSGKSPMAVLRTGSGERLVRHLNPRCTGQGDKAAGGLRRFGQATGSVACVK